MDTSVHEEELAQLRASLESEEGKRSRWQVENIRRKHNYLPLIVNMMKILAEEGKLLPIYHAAREKARARHEKEKERKKEKASAWQGKLIPVISQKFEPNPCYHSAGDIETMVAVSRV